MCLFYLGILLGEHVHYSRHSRVSGTFLPLLGANVGHGRHGPRHYLTITSSRYLVLSEDDATIPIIP